MDATSHLYIDFRNPIRGELKRAILLNDKFFTLLDQEEISEGNIRAVYALREMADDHFQLKISIEGHVITTCDRCLEPVLLEVATEETVKMVFEDEEDSEADIVITRRNPIVDLSWTIYEIISTSLPLERTHKEGGCNSDMIGRISGSIDTTEIHRNAGAET